MIKLEESTNWLEEIKRDYILIRVEGDKIRKDSEYKNSEARRRSFLEYSAAKKRLHNLIKRDKSICEKLVSEVLDITELDNVLLTPEDDFIFFNGEGAAYAFGFRTGDGVYLNDVVHLVNGKNLIDVLNFQLSAKDFWG